MTFWPFDKSPGGSNVNKILDQYFNLLGVLETSDSLVAEYVRQEFYHDDELQDLQSDKSVVLSNVTSSPTASLKVMRTNSGSTKALRSVKSVASLNKTPSLECGSGTSTNKDKIDGIDASQLNESFLLDLLDEPDLANELSLKDTKLIEFICCGFFFDSKTGRKKQNLEYLIDFLIHQVDNTGLSKKPSTALTTTAFFDSESDNETIENSTSTLNDIADDDDEYNTAYKNDDKNSEVVAPAESMHTNFNINDTMESEKVNVVADIITLDAWLLNETILKNELYFEKIWSLLNFEEFGNKNSPMVVVFLKVQQNLLAAKPFDYIQYLTSKSTLTDELLKHIEIPMIMDYFLQCLATDKIDFPTDIVQKVSEQNLIDKCLKILEDTKISTNVHVSVGDFLNALIAISANTILHDMSIGPNVLTRQLVSPENSNRIIDLIKTKKGVELTSIVTIVIEIIRKNNSDYDQINIIDTTLQKNVPNDRDPIFLGYFLEAFSLRLPELFQVIIDAESNLKSEKYHLNQIGEKFKPLGLERYKIGELIAELLHCSNMGLLNSKKSELIAIQRDRYRDNHKQNTFQKILTNNDSTDNEMAGINSDDDDTFTNDDDNYNKNNTANIDEITDDTDETFDIPYINESQNTKLRNNWTIGDLFKIKLHDTFILQKLMALFLEYPWNNFWHHVIFDIIQQIFSGRMDQSYNLFLVNSLFDSKDAKQYVDKDYIPLITIPDFQLIRDLILKGYHTSYLFYEKTCTNLGYIGHLALIAEEVLKFSKLYKSNLISPRIKDKFDESDWIYYSEEVLAETREMYSKILGGGSYIEDESGNIIPSFSNIDDDQNQSNKDDKNTKVANIDDLEEQLTSSTESDLHSKLRKMLISSAQDEVDARNAEKGVIILGPS